MNDIVFTDYPGHGVTLLLAGVATALVVCSFRASELRRLPMLRWVLGALSLVTVLVLIVLTWNPSRVTQTQRRRQNTLWVCFDTSESMSVTDGSQSRLAQARAAFDRCFVKGRADRPRCRWYGFDSEFRALSPMDIGRQWGGRSNLEVAWAGLADVVPASDQAKGQDELSPCGIVVFTDGQVDNKQVQSYAKLPQKDCPVVMVACGNDGPCTDVSVRSVKAPISVRADQPYDIVAQVAARHLGNQPVDVELWINDVLTDHTSMVIAQQEEPQDVRFSTYALAPGVDEVRVVARAAEGELNVSNNARSCLVEVQADAPLRVLLYSQVASFDMAGVRQCLTRDLRVQLDFVYDVLIDANLPKEQADRPGRFPQSLGQLNRYDLIVLGPCRFDRFSGGQIAGLYDFVTKGGGSVVFLPGREPFGPEPCDVEAIRTLVPVDFSVAVSAPPLKGLSLTQEGRDQHYSESLCEESRGNDVDVAYASLSKKPAASTVLRCGQQPLVCTQRLGRGKTAMVNSRNLYQLYREDQEGGPLFRLLSDIITDVGERPRRQSHIEVFVRRSSDAADLVFEACVTDRAFAAAQHATVLLEFDGRITRMNEAWPGTYTATIPGFEGSSVFARVRVEHQDVYLGDKAVAVELDEARGEMDDTRCDKAFLQALCEHVGAAYVDANQIGPETFDRFEPYHLALQDTQLERIWPRWPVFALLCSVLFLQWFLRRAKGLV